MSCGWLGWTRVGVIHVHFYVWPLVRRAKSRWVTDLDRSGWCWINPMSLHPGFIFLSKLLVPIL